jgi:hypothetical protein
MDKAIPKIRLPIESRQMLILVLLISAQFTCVDTDKTLSKYQTSSCVSYKHQLHALWEQSGRTTMPTIHPLIMSRLRMSETIYSHTCHFGLHRVACSFALSNKQAIRAIAEHQWSERVTLAAVMLCTYSIRPWSGRYKRRTEILSTEQDRMGLK